MISDLVKSAIPDKRGTRLCHATVTLPERENEKSKNNYLSQILSSISWYNFFSPSARFLGVWSTCSAFSKKHRRGRKKHRRTPRRAKKKYSISAINMLDNKQHLIDRFFDSTTPKQYIFKPANLLPANFKCPLLYCYSLYIPFPINYIYIIQAVLS